MTAQRLEGRDQRLSIRGLGPDFSTTLLNGREQVTVGDNRGVEYDQYPSEFFSNVVVQKSPDASLIAAGIAGTVDLRMLRPLAQKDRIIAVQARGQMNGLKSLNPDSPRYGYRGSAAYVDKFADDTLGIALGVSVSSSPSQNERYAAWGFPNAPEAGGALLLGGAKPYVQSNLFDRYGAVATIEYQPSDNFHSTLDVLYSKFKETQRLRGIEFPINPGWGSGATLQPGYTVVDGFVTKATLTGVQAVQRNDINKRDADTLSIGWNNVIGLGGSKHLKIDAAWSRSTRTDFLLETYTGAGYNGAGPKDTINITRTRLDKLPSVLDFAFRSAVLATVAGNAGTDTLEKLFAADVLYEGGEATARQLPTFTGNHDFGRFAFFARKAFPKPDDDEIQKRVNLAHAMMFMLRGVPVIYSGDEQGFAGDGIDQDARETLFASKVGSYNDNKLVGTTATTAQANFVTTQPIYRALSDNHDVNSWHGNDAENYGAGFEAFAVLAATLPGVPLVYGGQEGVLDKRIAFFEKDAIDWKGYKRAPLYRRLLTMKSRNPALWNGVAGGTLTFAETGSPDVIAFTRTRGRHKVLVVANLSGATHITAFGALDPWATQIVER